MCYLSLVISQSGIDGEVVVVRNAADLGRAVVAVGCNLDEATPKHACQQTAGRSR